MARYLIQRFLTSALILVAGLTVVFVLTRVVPADPARLVLGIDADPETVERYREEAGLNEPLWDQYGAYLGQLAQGDLGTSIQTRQPVVDELLRFYPATLELTLVTTIFTIIFAVLLGSISGMTKRPTVDRAVRYLALGTYAIAPFWLGLILQLIFYANLGILPATGRIGPGVSPPDSITGLYLVDSLLTMDMEAFVSSAQHLALPVTTLVFAQTGLLIRMLRGSILDVKQRAYVTTAHAKGLDRPAVFRGHVLRNALLPVLTMAGIQIGWLLTGTVVVETIFGWPGIGRYAVESITYLDYAPLLAVTLAALIVFIVINLVVDLLYAVADPRIRLGT